MISLRTDDRLLLTGVDQCPENALLPIVEVWLSLKNDPEDLPSFASFDVTLLPPALWSRLFLCKLIGQPRRFFYELAGSEIEWHNGFPVEKRFLTDIQLRNRHVMAREYALTLRHGLPIYSQGPYVGKADYVKQVRRIIAPYRISEREFAFVAGATFVEQP